MKTEEVEAELRSLKQTILESKLHDYFPKREMSFHDKVALAIGLMSDKAAIITDTTDDDIKAWAEEVQPLRGGYISDYIYSAKAMRGGKIKSNNNRNNESGQIRNNRNV